MKSLIETFSYAAKHWDNNPSRGRLIAYHGYVLAELNKHFASSRYLSDDFTFETRRKLSKQDGDVANIIGGGLHSIEGIEVLFIAVGGVFLPHIFVAAGAVGLVALFATEAYHFSKNKHTRENESSTHAALRGYSYYMLQKKIADTSTFYLAREIMHIQDDAILDLAQQHVQLLVKALKKILSEGNNRYTIPQLVNRILEPLHVVPSNEIEKVALLMADYRSKRGMSRLVFKKSSSRETILDAITEKCVEYLNRRNLHSLMIIQAQIAYLNIYGSASKNIINIGQLFHSLFQENIVELEHLYPHAREGRFKISFWGKQAIVKFFRKQYYHFEELLATIAVLLLRIYKQFQNEEGIDEDATLPSYQWIAEQNLDKYGATLQDINIINKKIEILEACNGDFMDRLSKLEEKNEEYLARLKTETERNEILMQWMRENFPASKSIPMPRNRIDSNKCINRTPVSLHSYPEKKLTYSPP